VKEIILTTINAKWIHPSLALRLLKANLGPLEDSCEIIEFALRQKLEEKIEPLVSASARETFVAVQRLRIIGISVSIWNHSATTELLKELEKNWIKKPVIILGGPEVSHLPPDAEIFRYADYVIRGEGEIAFRELCEDILAGRQLPSVTQPQFITAGDVDISKIKSAYHLYTDEDLFKKLIYVEASRGCLFNCDFCLSALATELPALAVKNTKRAAVREFPLEPFLAEMDILIKRGVKTFKFLDRSVNINIKRAIKILEFFLSACIGVSGKKNSCAQETFVAVQRLQDAFPYSPVVHFEMVPSIFPDELRETLTLFPPGTLRLEIGIQTLNSEVAARIGRPSNPEKELEALCFLREKTHAIIHADLIAGLPGEDLASFGKGFDRLWSVLRGDNTEIQLGILKQLPGAPISRHNENFKMRYNPLPPYEIEETSAMSAVDLQRIKNFARFWEILVNRKLINLREIKNVFDKFMALSDSLLAHFGRNWGIDKDELQEAVKTKRDEQLFF